jgi:hypothetical protein
LVTAFICGTSVVQKTDISTPQLNSAAVQEAETIAMLDTRSLTWRGTPISPSQIKIAKTPYVAPGVGTLSQEEMAIARQAWLYFQHNWNNDTGLVNSVDGSNFVTMWDQATAIAALVSAKELNIIPASELEAKLDKMLETLKSIPLYKDELPNKAYNSKTLIPINSNQPEKWQETGWSAIDLGRMAIWLKIIAAKYPHSSPHVEALWRHWRVKRLTNNGQIYGTRIVQEKEEYKQEGRLGYENYSACGLKLWGLNVSQALDYHSHTAFVNLYGQGIPYDQRNYKNSGAANYVLSGPYILDGIETGFQTLPKAYADRILAAQEARYRVTNQLTAVTEDYLDRPPHFVYNCLFVNGEPWSAIAPTGQKYNHLRFLSTTAAIGWHVLYNSAYTRQLFDFVRLHLKSSKGWYSGFYEFLREPNQALTAHNNGIILETLLYKQVGKPLTVWAKVLQTPRSSCSHAAAE